MNLISKLALNMITGQPSSRMSIRRSPAPGVMDQPSEIPTPPPGRGVIEQFSYTPTHSWGILHPFPWGN